jgi:hypothetical protein
LINLLFSELSSLSKQTALLESLDWSEERLEEVIEICSISISEMSKNPARFSDPEAFKSHLRSRLVKKLSEDQVKKLFELLNEMILSCIEQMGQYEN